jgi:hypothetical protein
MVIRDTPEEEGRGATSSSLLKSKAGHSLPMARAAANGWASLGEAQAEAKSCMAKPTSLPADSRKRVSLESKTDERSPQNRGQGRAVNLMGRRGLSRSQS